MTDNREALVLGPGTCPECGGRLVDGLACQEMFHTLLAWEWQDSELLAMHFHTVSSYLLQHPASLTDEAVSGLRSAFARVLNGEIATEQVRADASSAYDGATRVRRHARDVRPVLRTWSMTVADVYACGQDGAAGRVQAWAQAIQSELDEDASRDLNGSVHRGRR